MAINNAAKYESKTSNLVKAERKSKVFTNQDWNWDGVDTIKVYTLTSPTMGDYDATAAANRYGTPSEVQDTIQTWTLTEDRAWTKVMDKKNKADTMNVRKPGAYLAQSIREVFVPEFDAYIFSTINAAGAVANRDDIVADAATTDVNAYNNLIDINANITDLEQPENGRVVAMTATYYNKLKQGNFVLASDSAYGDRKSGNLGTVDNCKIVVVPSSRMPAGVDLIISHSSVTVAPEKLTDWTVHENAPGYSGDLMEYRHRYDAFVDSNRVNSIGIHRTVA